MLVFVDQFGGVYDIVMGVKVDFVVNNFCWLSSGFGSVMGVCFFNYYGDVNYGYLIYFGIFEICEVFCLGVMVGGFVGYVVEYIVDCKVCRYDDNGNLIEQVD